MKSTNNIGKSSIYKTQRDPLITTIFTITSLLIPASISPVFFEDNIPVGIWFLVAAMGLLTALIIWMFVDIKYEFCHDYLFVKGGPFRSKIKYSDITDVKATANPWYGYRIMGAASGVEIFYKTAMTGSVKISPVDEELFLDELKKRMGA